MRSASQWLPKSPILRSGLVVFLALGLGIGILSRRPTSGDDPETLIAADVPPVEIDAETERQIVSFCSACHAMPMASSFARDSWHAEVMRGYQFYAQSGRKDLEVPAPYLVISYFRSKAPDAVELPEQLDDSVNSRIVFRADRSAHDKTAKIPPAVAHLKWLPRPENPAGLLVSCDMRLGTVSGIEVSTKRVVHSVRISGSHPCHAEPCDLDRDGVQDLVVADLGSFEPDDHDRGRVLWVRGDAEGNWTAEPLAEKLGRVADVRPIDLDRDGDLDLVVAEFGWHATGGILVLRNQAEMNPSNKNQLETSSNLNFRVERIDSRPGTIHVPCADFDGDGLPEIVALVSQEHERVELLLNRGDHPWARRLLWAAPDPAFGMSGLELVDFDQDGDVDILFTNGDTFDSMTVKPSHGIQWLRNDGQLRFVYQRIADLSGVYRTAAADFDRDGDLDLIASVWMQEPESNVQSADRNRTSTLVLFEQIAPLKFSRQTLSSGHPSIATLEVGDFDRDGDQDFAVDSLLTQFEHADDGLVIWWNLSKP